MRNPLVAARLFGTPLMAEPAKALTVAEVFLGRDGFAAGGVATSMPSSLGVVGETAGEAILPLSRAADGRLQPQPSAGPAGELMAGALTRRNLAPFPVVDGVAVIQIDGSLVNRGAWIGAESGLVSYQGVQAQIRRAQAMPEVRGVALDIDSFGGEVQGAFETAAMIAELARAKPVIAILDATAASAAYLLASQARRVVAPRDGLAGSVGALMMHINRSRELGNRGVEITFVHAGEQKVEGNEAEPLAAATRARWQAWVDDIRLRFAETVASARPGLTVDDLLATEAGVFTGEEALARRLVDAVAEPTAAFAAFRAAVNRGQAAPL